MQQANDFKAVSAQLDALLFDLDEDDFDRPTAFKSWSTNHILTHLHVWNRAAFLSLRDEGAFDTFMQAVVASRGKNFREFESHHAGGLQGRALHDAWRAFYPELAEAFGAADPKTRLPWVGPSMSARSSITARLMETWSHAQAIFDEWGRERPPIEGGADPLANIVVLGLNTYDWSFKNRGLEAPRPRPQLALTMATGDVHMFGAPDDDEAVGERIEGTAEQFCQVVTQCRNVADTSLNVQGENAARWMEIAQCFAGPPQDPPPAGTRVRKA